MALEEAWFIIKASSLDEANMKAYLMSLTPEERKQVMAQIQGAQSQLTSRQLGVAGKTPPSPAPQTQTPASPGTFSDAHGMEWDQTPISPDPTGQLSPTTMNTAMAGGTSYKSPGGQWQNRAAQTPAAPPAASTLPKNWSGAAAAQGRLMPGRVQDAKEGVGRFLGGL